MCGLVPGNAINVLRHRSFAVRLPIAALEFQHIRFRPGPTWRTPNNNQRTVGDLGRDVSQRSALERAAPRSSSRRRWRAQDLGRGGMFKRE